jgi:hypothetical protein
MGFNSGLKGLTFHTEISNGLLFVCLVWMGNLYCQWFLFGVVRIEYFHVHSLLLLNLGLSVNSPNIGINYRLSCFTFIYFMFIHCNPYQKCQWFILTKLLRISTTWGWCPWDIRLTKVWHISPFLRVRNAIRKIDWPTLLFLNYCKCFFILWREIIKD